MLTKHKILGLIPARGGSKGIPGKNIIPLGGDPLISYSIKAALDSSCLDRIIVSTDDKEIAAVSESYGAEVPFLRPIQYSGDNSGAIEVIQHAVTYLEKTEKWSPDFIFYLQPTSPLRTADSIKLAVCKMIESDADSLVSVTRVPHQFSLDSQLMLSDGYLEPLQKSKNKIFRRQDKTVSYARNGPAILIMRHSTVMNGNSLYGDKVLPFEMSSEESVDIDTHYDLELAEVLIARRKS